MAMKSGVRGATTMGHYSEHIEAAKSQGATHLGHAAESNATHSILSRGAGAVPNPLPKPMMVPGSEVGTPPEPKPGTEIGSRIM